MAKTAPVSGDLIVRDATVGDAETLVSFLHEIVADPTANTPLAPDEVTVTIDEERTMLSTLGPREKWLVAVLDGDIVGQLRLRAISTRRALSHVVVLGMSVRRPWRRCGVGRALMAEAVGWAPRAGISRIELYVYARNDAAIRLYESFDFEHEGRRRRIIREGDSFLDDLVMARLF